MGGGEKQRALFSAAVLKVSMVQKGLGDAPGFRVVYMGTIKDLGVTDDEVNAYIEGHYQEIVRHIEEHRSSQQENKIR